MAQFRNIFPVDLQTGYKDPVPLMQPVGEGDAKGVRVGARVTNNGADVDLGGQCVGKVIRADGSTVPLTGTISGNQAYVTLDQTCCAIDGPIQVAVAWVSGTNITTLVVAYGTVVNTITGNTVQPSTPIPDLTQLLAEIDHMRTATADAEAAASKSVRYDTTQELTAAQQLTARNNISAARAGIIDIFAVAFDATIDYYAGDYCTYSGSLWRFTADHPAGAWKGDDPNPANRDVRTVTVGNEINNTTIKVNKSQSLSGTQKAQARANIDAAAIGTLAVAFDASTTYHPGEYCTRNGSLYRFTATHTGAWNNSHVVAVTIGNEINATTVKTNVSQSLTDDQKIRARNNIGAASADVVNELNDTSEAGINASKNMIRVLLDKDFGTPETAVYHGYDSNNTSATAPANTPFIIPSGFYNNIITAIKADVVTAGTLSVGYINTMPLHDTAYDPTQIVITNSMVIHETGVQIIYLPVPFCVPAGGALVVQNYGDTVRWKYGTNGTDTKFFYTNHSEGKYKLSSNSIGLDIFCVLIADYGSILDTYAATKGNVDFMMSQYQSITFCDGYDALNATSAAFNNAPFIVRQFNRGYLKTIKLNFATTGVLSIGKIKADDVVAGGTLDSSKIHIHEVLQIGQTGEQTITLSSYMELETDDYIVLGAKTDTARFKYGTYGTDKGFFYVAVAAGTTISASGSSLGVKFDGIKSSSGTGESVYKDKTLSILGDSISTFAGYIPEGNATYYPSGTVQNVADTWWHKLYTALGMTLDVNNSWSGSRVTTTGGEASAGCMTRCQSLGTSPDVIIVWMGINDFNNEVPLGTYDGKSAVPTSTTTFREAYGIMLNKILTKYQSSEVWVCTLPQCERNSPSDAFPEVNANGVPLADFNAAIKELAESFGVKVLDHNKCGLTYQNMPTYNPDNLHPNKNGHSLVANNDIRQMDNFVRVRY